MCEMREYTQVQIIVIYLFIIIFRYNRILTTPIIITFIIRLKHKSIFGVSCVRISNILFDDKKTLPIDLTKTHHPNNS